MLSAFGDRVLSSKRLIIILLHVSFLHQRQLAIFHWSQTGSKSPCMSRILLNIFANLNNAVDLYGLESPTDF